ncbi:MAG: hypothetical protein IAE87_05640 [Rhodobacteraceae bacterium]|jgi:hypothetical protein|nr:hypothetical protein [Paracoccaceae bacterium]
MRFRGHLINGANALLFAGPFAAGLAGYGWALVPPFLAIFAIWSAIRRPDQWLQGFGGRHDPTRIFALAGRVLVLTALVVGGFVTGRGIGGVLGVMPALHPVLPAILSFVALPFLRLLWSPNVAMAGTILFEEMPEIHHPRRLSAEGEAAVAHLVIACEDTDPVEAEVLLVATLDAADAEARLNRLSGILSDRPDTLHAPLRRALIGWATRPVAFAEGHGLPGAMLAAFLAAAGSDELLRLLLPRAAVLLHAAPRRFAQFPPPAVLEDMACRSTDAAVASALRALAGVLDRLAPAPMPRSLPAGARRSRAAAI